MKRYRYLLLVLFAGFFSCNNFLNVTPKNVISMDDMESVKKTLGGFLYNIREDGSGTNSMPRSPFENPTRYLMQYSEEWDLSKYAEKMLDYQMEIIDWRSLSTQSLWSNYYRPIGLMNLVLYEAQRASGDEDMRDYVMGEAYVMRAYCFFKLIQFFAPYKNNELGIPVCLESHEDFEKVNVARRTQKEVYSQIFSDLQKAETLLARTPTRESFNLMYSTSVVNRLLATIYHFKAMSAAAEADDWKNAIVYANRETNGKTLLSDPEVLKKIFEGDSKTVEFDPECAVRLYCSGGGGAGGNNAGFSSVDPSQAFYADYFPNDDDIRRKLYYRMHTYTDYNNYPYVQVTELKVDKFSSYTVGSWGYVHFGFRLSETFLIQAEALAMSDKLPEAKAILTRFKTARYTSTFTVPDQKEALLTEIYRERKKEFLAEGDIAWLDMKRLGVKMERTIGGVTFKLNGEGDYRYSFPIPNSELDANKEIKQNPEWELVD